MMRSRRLSRSPVLMRAAARWTTTSRSLPRTLLRIRTKTRPRVRATRTNSYQTGKGGLEWPPFLRIDLLRIAMDRLWRECRETNGYIFSRFGWGGVLDPFARMRDDGLPCADIKFTVFVPNMERSPEHNGELLKFRSLSRFHPSLRAAHVRNTEPALLRIYPAHIFINQLGHVAGGANSRW